MLLRLAERERELDSRHRAGARLWLGAYWLAAALGTLWVLTRLPWPDGAGSVAWGVAVLAVPAGFMVSLWPEQARECLQLCARPLLPPER